MTESKPTGAEYLRQIIKAPVYDVAHVSPLQEMTRLSEQIGRAHV